MALVQIIISVILIAACGFLRDPEESLNSPTPQPATVGPAVQIGDTLFDVEIARTSEERQRGLSGRESLPNMSGMLFMFDSGTASSFWMKGMLIPLDFVWIGDECTVVDLIADAKAPDPDTPDSDLPHYRSGIPGKYVLEVNAGRISDLRIETGDPVRFHGISGSGAICS